MGDKAEKTIGTTSGDATANPTKTSPVRQDTALISGATTLSKEDTTTASHPVIIPSGSDESNKVISPSSPIQDLWTFAQSHPHKETWGVTLSNPATHIPSQVILQKYLNANDGDPTRAKDQLKQTLDYRAKHNPTALTEKHFSRDKFAGLGFITSYTSSSSNAREVFTWNIYGGVKDIQKSFGDLDAFVEWRVALMELAMQTLDIGSATTPITETEDPWKIYQVHDYKGVSFLRSPPAVRGAAKRTVEVLAMAYPETLKEKFFVNVPAIMGFMYGVMKLFVAPKTIKKFHPMSNGGALHLEFSESKVQGLGEKLPKEYGGKGEELSAVGKEPLLE